MQRFIKVLQSFQCASAKEDRRLRDRLPEDEIAVISDGISSNDPDAAIILVDLMTIAIHEIHTRVRLKKLHRCDDGMRFIGIVSVQPADDLTPGTLKALVQRMRLPSIRLGGPDQMGMIFEDLYGPICGTTVHDDMFHV